MTWPDPLPPLFERNSIKDVDTVGVAKLDPILYLDPNRTDIWLATGEVSLTSIKWVGSGLTRLTDIWLAKKDLFI